MKSEYSKMLNHEWYDANNDTELVESVKKAQDLCYEFNQLRPSDDDGKQEIAEKIFDQQLDNVRIIQPLLVDYGKLTTIGSNVFINSDAYFMDGGQITIGDNAFIGPKCGFYTALHAENIEDRNKGLEKALPITIEDNVWLGGNVSILPGVTIGEGSIIGAGSVVHKDIPANSVAVGVPCRVVRAVDERN